MIEYVYLRKIIMCSAFMLILSASFVNAANKELVVVFSGDTLGYVEPCG